MSGFRQFNLLTRRVGEYLASLWKDQGGLSATEYALLLAVLALGVLVAFADLGSQVDTCVLEGSQRLEEASGMGCGQH